MFLTEPVSGACKNFRPLLGVFSFLSSEEQATRFACVQDSKGGGWRTEPGLIAISEAIKRRKLASRVGVAEFFSRKISVTAQNLSGDLCVTGPVSEAKT